MVSKIVLALCVLVAVASAVPAVGGPGGWGAGGWGAPAVGGWGAPAPGAWGAPAPGAWAPSSNPFIPPWVASAPWFPVWTPCTTIGSTCADCNTKVVCTKIGGIQRACTDPKTPYCTLGNCTATPSAECAPVSAVPATV